MAELESSILMKNGSSLDLSEQQVLNCNPYGEDCNHGGLATDAWAWMQSNGGVAAESQIPYVAGSGAYGPSGSGVGTCTPPSNAAGTSPAGWTSVWPYNDDGLAPALLSNPVKVGLYVGPQFQHYSSGVLTCTAAESGWSTINHEIQAVGLTTITTSAGVSIPVYIAKNQWGTNWGSYGGYVYIQRASATDRPYGTCGIGSDADWLW